MRTPLVALALAVAAVLAGTALFTGADERALSAAAEAETARGGIAHENVTSFDGTTIAITVFRPANATADAPVPVILHGHGWSGSRATSPTGIVARLVQDGFGVVSIDARGHGESGGLATVHHEDAEVKDFQAVLDWVATRLDWVQREEGSVPNDVVAGATGYSYGGAFQLMLASHDARLDAIAPEITWSFLPDALAPQGAVKSVWVHALIAQAKETGTRIDPRLERWYQEAMLTNAFPQDAYEHFLGSSPELEAITADVLLIQGIPDVLFNLNQAVRAYAALEARPVGDVRLFTHLTGHVLPIQPFAADAARRMPYEVETPCGNLHDLVATWLDAKLRDGDASSIPEASFAMGPDDCLRLDAYPRAPLTVALAAAPAPTAAGTLLVPVAEGPLTLAGVPHLAAELIGLPTGGFAFAGLAVAGPEGGLRIVDDQTQPVPLNGMRIDLDLAGIATRVAEGETLLLRIDGLNEWYATNGHRAPGGALLENLRVTLPLAPSA